MYNMIIDHYMKGTKLKLCSDYELTKYTPYLTLMDSSDEKIPRMYYIIELDSIALVEYVTKSFLYRIMKCYLNPLSFQ